ncbi:MAG: tetratricopeptide repeat protein [Promethearchaeota archaeon]|nr:MAG: tetratricopeptide repeat protein [Candidatus Lokiarchaeota archaeon]
MRKEIGNLEGVGHSITRIVQSLKELKQYEKALKKTDEAIGIFEQLNMLNYRANVLVEKGKILLELNQKPAANDLFKDAIEIYKKLDNKKSMKSTSELIVD